MAKYDRTEAEAIIARARGSSRDFYGAMGAAANDLLDELAQLHGFCGGHFKWDDPHESVEIQFGTKATWVAYFKNEHKFFFQGANGATELPGLRFDPVKGLWEGADDDTFIVPTPGQPRAKRPALAVIVEHVCKVLVATSG